MNLLPILFLAEQHTVFYTIYIRESQCSTLWVLGPHFPLPASQEARHERR